MKFTLSWLKEHLQTDASVDEIARTLTRVGLEVEHVDDPAKALAPFRIASVISAEQHPNADRLRVCMVDAGDGPVQVVCGAPNARAGMKAVFAAPGALIPATATELKVGTIRGVESRGMLVSERELGLSEKHAGIIELPADAPVGVSFAAWRKLADPVFDVAVTPNRPDCLGVSGIARDLAAAGLGTLVAHAALPPLKGGFPSPVSVTLDLGDAPHLCPAFALRLVRGVRNGPSPDWLQKRLRAIGLRPINALVDVTNFLTFDRNRPLHVFDAAKVGGNLAVRRAVAGEEVLALDGRSYRLDETMVVIADGKGVESIAGIMGGEATGCTEETTDVLVELALWDALNIAQTGRRLGINSDARFRFERGVDPEFCVPGLELATRLILDLCGGEPSEIVLAGSVPMTRKIVDFPLSEVRRLTGLEQDLSRTKDIFSRLGFTSAGHGDHLVVTVPSWRPDVGGKADLVEEVVRIVGVDAIPVRPLPKKEGVERPVLTLGQRRTRTARRALAARGLVEAVTWSFVTRNEAELFGGGQPELVLANPISAEMSDMRPSLLPGLGAAAKRNADRGFADLAVFEVGQIYRGVRPEDQVMAATGLRAGTAKVGGASRHWSENAEPVDLFDAKADLIALLDGLGAAVDRLQIVRGGPAWFHPGRVGTVQLGPKAILGWFGELHPTVLERLDLSGPIAAFELILDAVPAPKVRATKTRPPLDLPDLQPVRRDFAFVVDRAVEAGRIMRAAEATDRALITAVQVFDIFEGGAIGEGKKSVAIEVTLQPNERTMTDVEIDAVAARIVAEVGKATGAVLRA